MALTTPRRDHRLIRHRHRHSSLPPSEDLGTPWGPPCGLGWARAHHHRGKDRGPIRRRADERLLGGIAGGLSARTGLDPTVVRIGLVLFGLASGVGIAAYVVAWLLVPVEGETTSIGTRSLSDARGLALAVALAPGLVITLLLASAFQAGFLSSLAWPLFISAAGLVLIWRNGSPAERLLLRQATAPLMQIGGGARGTWRSLVRRVIVGLAVAAAGVVALTLGHHNSLLRPLGGVALVLASIVVIFGPWWLSVARELVFERQARLRAEERADLASRVHDSVLQTLAMIQRHAEEPQKVAQLARAQERELRSWLFEGLPPGSFADGLGTVAAAVRCIQSEVEADHGVKAETVVVGDAPLTDNLEALLAAAREAAVNAAKWSGAEVVSLFAEVEPGKVSLFVRDRGSGFDPSGVAADRKGIAESIEGRMARSGGTAVVRTAPGEGTEVELTVDRGDRAGTARRGNK